LKGTQGRGRKKSSGFFPGAALSGKIRRIFPRRAARARTDFCKSLNGLRRAFLRLRARGCGERWVTLGRRSRPRQRALPFGIPSCACGRGKGFRRINMRRALQNPFFDYNSNDTKCSDGDSPDASRIASRKMVQVRTVDIRKQSPLSSQLKDFSSKRSRVRPLQRRRMHVRHERAYLYANMGGTASLRPMG